MSSGVLKPFLYESVLHAYKMLTDKRYRVFMILSSKLSNLPRYTCVKKRIDGWELSIPDAASFLSSYQEIFVEQIYSFNSASPVPRILDLGANIGLSVLYFKQLYPEAHITAFEADPAIFKHLEQNVYGSGYRDVRLVNKAVWNENTSLRFSCEGADGGRIARENDDNVISVEAEDIREILQSDSYDFLKMDIEGAEEIVFPACQEFLPEFNQIFIEYHSIVGHKQCLDRIITMLSMASFRVYIHNVTQRRSPFMTSRTNSRFDLQLNIFAWKEPC